MTTGMRFSIWAALALCLGSVAQAGEPFPEVSRRSERASVAHGLPYTTRVEALDVAATPEAGAEIVSFAYIAQSSPEVRRPVIFFFPGGPGVSAASLIVGGFGPEVVDYRGHPSGAAVLVPNPDSLLGRADLVFVDMPEIGFSRLKPGVASDRMFGITQDAGLQAAFVARWLAKHERTDAPVILAGHSYGGIRVTYTALALAKSYPGIRLRGVVLLAATWDLAAMDFPDGFTAAGRTDAYWNYLPSFAAIASARAGRDGQGALERAVREARDFAIDQYLPWLARQDAVGTAMTSTLSRLTGLPSATVRRVGGRLDSQSFREGLVPGVTLGFDDGTLDAKAEPNDFGGDQYLPRAWTAYLTKLDIPTERSYRPTSFAFSGQWDWIAKSSWRMGYPRVVDGLIPLATLRPDLRIFAATGYFDLAAPFLMAEQGAKDGRLPRGYVEVRHYAAGHSLWVRPAARTALQKDLAAFVDGVVKP